MDREDRRVMVFLECIIGMWYFGIGYKYCVLCGFMLLMFLRDFINYLLYVFNVV